MFYLLYLMESYLVSTNRCNAHQTGAISGHFRHELDVYELAFLQRIVLLPTKASRNEVEKTPEYIS